MQWLYGGFTVPKKLQFGQKTSVKQYAVVRNNISNIVYF